MSNMEDVRNEFMELRNQIKELGLLGNRLFALEAFAECVYRLLPPEDQEKVHMMLDGIRNRRVEDIKSILSATGSEMDVRTFNAIFDQFVAALHKSASH